MSEFALEEVFLKAASGPMPEALAEFITEAEQVGKEVGCFGYVPSDAQVLYAKLQTLPRGHFCEWGSGIGVGVGVAAWLGFEAHGIELYEPLAEASNSLLRTHSLIAQVTAGSYFEVEHEADVYFVYCWPSQMKQVQEHFIESTPPQARLLICHGAEDIRCKVKVSR